MQITAQNVIDLMQTAIIAFCLVRIIQLNMGIKDLKIRFKTILKYKQLTLDYMKMIIDISPVDLCAKSILDIIKNNNNQTIYHIYNNNTFSIEDLLNAIDVHVNIVESAELAKKLHTSSNPLDAHLLNDLNNGGYMETPTTCKLTTNWLSSIEFNWPVLDKNYLTNIFK